MSKSIKVYDSYERVNKATTLGTAAPTSATQEGAEAEAHGYSGDDTQVTFACEADTTANVWLWNGKFKKWFNTPAITAVANTLYSVPCPRRSFFFVQTNEGAPPNGWVMDQKTQN